MLWKLSIKWPLGPTFVSIILQWTQPISRFARRLLLWRRMILFKLQPLHVKRSSSQLGWAFQINQRRWTKCTYRASAQGFGTRQVCWHCRRRGLAQEGMTTKQILVSPTVVPVQPQQTLQVGCLHAGRNSPPCILVLSIKFFILIVLLIFLSKGYFPLGPEYNQYKILFCTFFVLHHHGRTIASNRFYFAWRKSRDTGSIHIKHWQRCIRL